jgi:hypothetical protein
MPRASDKATRDGQCCFVAASLDELQALVVDKFADMPNMDVARPAFGPPDAAYHAAFDKADFNKLCKVHPI